MVEEEAPKIRQIYMDLYDIIPTEGRYVKPVSFEECVDKSGYGLEEGVGIFKSEGWLEDIREKGALYAIKCHPDGHIADGNFRYWCYRDLYEETGDNKWRFIPVDVFFFNGNYRYDEDHITVRFDLIGNAPGDSGKHKIIPAEKELKEFPDDTLGHGQHPWTKITQLALIGLNMLPREEESK